MRLGIGSYTYTWAVGVPGYPLPAHPLTALDILETATRFGIETIQLSDNIDLAALSATELEQIRRHAAEQGKTLHVGTRGVSPEHMTRFLGIACALGAPLVRTIIPKTGAGSTMEEARGMFAEVIGDYEAADVAISVENHDCNTSAELLRLVEAIGSSRFGICLDTVNSYGIGEDHRRTLHALAPVANCFHAKDYRVSRLNHQMGFKIEGVPCGEGMLDLREVAELFARIGRDPDLIIELWTPYQGEIAATVELENAWAQKSVAYCKTLL